MNKNFKNDSRVQVGQIKKQLYILLLLLFFASPLFSAPCGDVNSSGMIDIVDALLVAQYYVGLNPSNFDSTAADVNGDSTIDIVDALLLAQYYVGLISSLPGCTQTPEPTLPPQSSTVPFIVQSGLFDHSQADTLGLSFAPGTETVTIFRPGDGDNAYNHGVVLIPFKGFLYAQWQSSEEDEDAPDTYVAYSRSTDGVNWEIRMTLAEEWNDGYRSSGGWWTDGETLVAYINTWPANQSPRGGYVEYITSTDGENWSDLTPLLDNKGEPVNGIFEQDPHALPDGRIISAVHEQPGIIVAPYYTDDPKGISGWTKGRMENLDNSGDVSREIEPSWFLRVDGSIVMIFRDQDGTYLKLASISTDRGENWSTPVLTDMPDSRSKQSAGNLPDNTAFMVNNPTNDKTRIPLVVTLSKDGFLFDRAFLLRAGGSDLQPMRFDGQYKREGYSYPKSVVWGDYLYVSYAANKEDVQLTRVLLNSLKY